MTEIRGLGLRMRVYVDSNHAGDAVTQRSRTGFFFFLNEAPIDWISKKQTSYETSTFGRKCFSMNHTVVYTRGLRYKIRILGIPCEDPTFVYGNNQSVLANTSVTDSTLKKKSNSIDLHFLREGCARYEWRTTYVNTHENPTYILTKTLPSGEKMWRFVRRFLYWI